MLLPINTSTAVWCFRSCPTIIVSRCFEVSGSPQGTDCVSPFDRRIVVGNALIIPDT